MMRTPVFASPEQVFSENNRLILEVTNALSMNNLGGGVNITMMAGSLDTLDFSADTSGLFVPRGRYDFSLKPKAGSMKHWGLEQLVRFGVRFLGKIRIVSTLILIVVSAVAASAASAQTASKTPPDRLGTVKSSNTVACSSGGITGGTCYKVVISCPQVADISAHLKVNQPTGTAIGTIIFGAGGNGVGYYDREFTFGQTAVGSVLSAGFISAQINFDGLSQGWMTGPGGPRKLACRYATAARWIYDHIRSDTSQPLCATGNSGGAAAIGYALAHYGMSSIFSMVELTSGPPQSRVDYGCICDQPSVGVSCHSGTLNQCYGVKTAQMSIDQAYGSNICSSAVTSHSRANASLFLNDSIDSADAVLSYPTDVHFIFGGKDSSSAVPLGQYYANRITSKHVVDCVGDAPHSIPNVLDGATKIADDMQAFCHK